MKFNLFSIQKLLTASLFFLMGLLLVTSQVEAQAQDCSSCSDPGNNFTCNKEKQTCWEDKIKATQAEAITLTSTINLINGQISLQQLQINQTLAEITQLEEEVIGLSQRIEGLGFSLDRLGAVLIKRVRAEYKQSRSSPSLRLLVTDSLSNLITKMKYLLLVQRQTANVMERTETQRLEYDEQKTLKEDKQLELENKQTVLRAQQITLDHQKQDKQSLLTKTQANEAIYQSELAKTLAELNAIQSIVAGYGNEQYVRDVNQGDNIASIIPGASTCSTGGHLHFEIVKNGSHQNPTNYLKSISIIWNNSPDGSFNFTGGWEWPLNDSARITQGYGLTHYAVVHRAYAGNPHTGIDMVSKTSGSYGVKAVRKGKLYLGSIGCRGGLLRYVKVEHSDDSEDTFYLHVNY